MDTAKKPTAKKKPIDDNAIISKYMDYVLEKNEEPKNVFSFCKEHKIEESDFYTFFGSFDALKQEIWVKFFENALATIQKEEAFEGYSDKNKLLTLYFTLFELMTLNRSYVLFSLKENKEGLKNLKSLKLFRNHFKDFIVNIISDSSESNDKINKVTKPIFSEGAWIQFLFLLKFWIDDTSKGFEKTDVLIEKSVNTVVDLLDTKPLESLFDLGKFLWKEKMN
ncbi:TetR family transcriptional regulator C-terminal domain-containing protein [Flavobacterium sp. SUN052]|uniref:TetR family transcriptional regulator C-terminal domain-containing protein n=1 Tax=Flavobacterium sp. SUN052 TaxID=3002441 RepID=UPI00237EA043|nr:TetR family transcriptional regulator C-terminal domain-containing protein [Flavobacterium sp. SUN052]MEC4005310.1 TetR family transcriptional regulator C-terminal domain-containing protein [Flavobacterium sp. SUN052]